jgi:hypothetical protein
MRPALPRPLAGVLAAPSRLACFTSGAGGVLPAVKTYTPNTAGGPHFLAGFVGLNDALFLFGFLSRGAPVTGPGFTRECGVNCCGHGGDDVVDYSTVGVACCVAEYLCNV